MQDWISDWKRWSRAERCFAIALVILSLAVNLLGDWLRDALNPKLR